MGNVLIVDDSSTMRRIISRSLTLAGFVFDTIYEACDGIEGRNVVTSVPQLDLVLADINMPNMDGFEFSREIRALGYMVPIVIISSETGEEREAEAISAGASFCIKKPFTHEKLHEMLSGLLS